jgi:hypothetical protein
VGGKIGLATDTQAVPTIALAGNPIFTKRLHRLIRIIAGLRGDGGAMVPCRKVAFIYAHSAYDARAIFFVPDKAEVVFHRVAAEWARLYALVIGHGFPSVCWLMMAAGAKSGRGGNACLAWRFAAFSETGKPADLIFCFGAIAPEALSRDRSALRMLRISLAVFST